MKLQQNVLTCYKEKFPDDTLKQISDKTGIQVTRVFRLFNGHEMKLSEYESFQRACLRSNEDNMFSKLFDMTAKSAQSLPLTSIKEIVALMEDTLELFSIKNDSLFDQYIEQIG